MTCGKEKCDCGCSGKKTTVKSKTKKTAKSKTKKGCGCGCDGSNKTKNTKSSYEPQPRKSDKKQLPPDIPIYGEDPKHPEKEFVYSEKQLNRISDEIKNLLSHQRTKLVHGDTPTFSLLPPSIVSSLEYDEPKTTRGIVELLAFLFNNGATKKILKNVYNTFFEDPTKAKTSTAWSEYYHILQLYQREVKRPYFQFSTLKTGMNTKEPISFIH